MIVDPRKKFPEITVLTRICRRKQHDGRITLVELGCINTTINCKDFDANGGIAYSIAKETQNL